MLSCRCDRSWRSCKVLPMANHSTSTGGAPPGYSGSHAAITGAFRYGVAHVENPCRRGKITLVADLTRRSLLRMSLGASAGAAGVWALSGLLDPLKPLAAPLAPAPFEPLTVLRPTPVAL